MPFGPSDVLWIGVVPASVAAAIMFLAGRLAVRPTAAWSWSVTGGLVVGMLTQNVRFGGRVALDKLIHPHAAIDWLPWLVLVAAGITSLAAYAPRSWQRWLVGLAGLFAIVAPMRLLASNALAMSRWSPSVKLGALTIWSIVFAALWLTFALGRRSGRPLLRGVLLVLVALGIALAVAATGSFIQGELGGVAAATLIGAIGAACLLGEMADGPSSAAGPLAVLFASLILLGHFHAGLSAAGAALLVLSLAAAAGPLPSVWPSRPIAQAALRTALTLVPLAIAVAVAIATVLADPYR